MKRKKSTNKTGINISKMNFVGTQIKALRQERNMSQQKLSDELKLMKIYVCRGSVSRIESGLRTVSDMELWGIAKVFGVSINSFFPSEE